MHSKVHRLKLKETGQGIENYDGIRNNSFERDYIINGVGMG